ncbi:MAG: DNA repair exonuclease [Candidatus Aenigmarchaeota archaeon]|nr:DNA repair exonuclease [Candidatus Aenigmarchaeota archaeon]
MKISIISDFHFGFGSGTERENDPYDAVNEAMEKSKGCDLIIMPGDLFDSRNPDAEVLSRSMEVLQKPLLWKSGVRFSGFSGNKPDVSKMALIGIPMVAIHGTHERRVKGLINPVQALEKAGFLIHLHCNGAVFEKDGKKVCIQGMSGVPDQYAESVLREWDPKPMEGAYNIFVLHQSITEFLYADNTIDLKKLPRGFDLYINGHIHDSKVSDYSGKKFLIPGSLIATQLRKEESKEPKSFFIFDTKTGKEEKVFLEKQRKFFFIEYSDNFDREMKRIIDENRDRKPIVRVSFPKESIPSEVEDIETKYSGKVILSVKREKGDEKRFDSKTLEEHKLSVEELGKKLLSENLEKEGLDPRTFENIFVLLGEGKTDEAKEVLEKMPKEKTAVSVKMVKGERKADVSKDDPEPKGKSSGDSVEPCQKALNSF